jgi:hypothetical protein
VFAEHLINTSRPVTKNAFFWDIALLVPSLGRLEKIITGRDSTSYSFDPNYETHDELVPIDTLTSLESL